MEQDLLFQQAEEAQLTAKRLVEEARQARQAREQARKRMRRRWDKPLFWFSDEDE